MQASGFDLGTIGIFHYGNKNLYGLVIEGLREREKALLLLEKGFGIVGAHFQFVPVKGARIEISVTAESLVFGSFDFESGDVRITEDRRAICVDTGQVLLEIDYASGAVSRYSSDGSPKVRGFTVVVPDNDAVKILRTLP